MKNSKLLTLFIYCLLRAAHSPKRVIIGLTTVNLMPGQFVFGRMSAARQLGIKSSTLRNHLLILKQDNTLDIKTTNKFSIVTIVNWELYQSLTSDLDSNVDSDLDNKLTTKGQQKDTDNNVNNVNKKNNTVEINSTVERVINYLNNTAGKKFQANTKNTVKLINARLKEGRKPEDFKTVIDNKVAKWLNDPERNEWLRPETLFTQTHFESYLNEKPPTPKSKIV